MIEIVVNQSDLDDLANDLKFKQARRRIVKAGLLATERIQIKRYNVSSNPDRLAYQRTLRLQRASRIRAGATRGRWDTDGTVDYASEVLGTPAQQSAIHRGRWIPITEVISRLENNLLEPIANSILNEEISNM